MESISCGYFLSSIWELLVKTAHGGTKDVQKSVDTISRDSEFLRKEMAELRRTRDDTVRKLVDAEAQRAVRRTDQVKEWVQKVDALDAVVAELQIASRNIAAASKGYLPLLDQVQDKLKDVRELQDNRGSISRLTELQDPAEQAVSAVESILRDDSVGIIGIHGPDGVGKTTLLKKVRNSHQALFPVVVFSTLPRKNSIRRLQEDLINGIAPFLFLQSKTFLGRLQFSTGQDWRIFHPGSFAGMLREALSEKRFLLLLDNVWEKLDLASIGIPAPNDRNKSKIVFTTSEIEVCSAMGARATVKMNRLDEAQSWELFRRKVGANAALDDPLIRPVAEEVVAHCGGLPLALITVGRAMAEKSLRIEWEHQAAKLAGMDTSLFSALKLSYDSLKDDKVRSCLLYCSLFPESSDIDKEQLIEYWIGEGLLDGADYHEVNLHVARNRGHSLIRSLLSAGLLESGSVDEEKNVKLPDVVRDMASSLTGAVSDGKNRFVALAGEGLAKLALPSEAWAEATRVSLMRNVIGLLFRPKIPPAPRLLTLLMNDNALASTKVFSPFIMPALTVLDLSRTSLRQPPPSLGDLKELRYLNLSRTCITFLPEELGNLTNLRLLDLSWTDFLTTIPCGAISPLRKLQMLNLYRSAYYWGDRPPSGRGNSQGAQAKLKSLEAFERLDEFGLNIKDLKCLTSVLNGSPRLRRSTMFLSLGRVNGLTTICLSTTLKMLTRLRELSLINCTQLEEFRVEDGQLLFLETLRLRSLPLSAVVAAPPSTGALLNLCGLHIERCHTLGSLTWAGRLPSLEVLHLCGCLGMELLTESEDEDSFPKLKVMDLRYLPKLRRLSCGTRLLLPSMERLEIKRCPYLKWLPFGPDSAKNLKCMSGEQEWWDELEWDGEQAGDAIKTTLESLLWPRNTMPDTDYDYAHDVLLSFK